MNVKELGDYMLQRTFFKEVDKEKQVEVIDEATQRVYLVVRATTDMTGRLVLIVKEAAL